MSGNLRESERLRALDRYAILDTPPEKAFDDIVRLATTLLEAPIGAVNFIAQGRQWLKAEIGLGRRALPLDHSVCAQAIQRPEGLVVADAWDDPRFAGMPLVAGMPDLRFYASEVLTTADGYALGTLCVLDTRPRRQGLSAHQSVILKTLAGQVMSQLDLRLAVLQRDAALAEQRRSETFRRQILDSALQYAIVSMNLAGKVTSWSLGAEAVLGWSEKEMLGQDIDRIFTPEDVAIGQPRREMQQAIQAGKGDDERWHQRADGSRFRASGMMTPLRADNGDVYGFVKILRDRTIEARRAERLALLAQASAGLLAATDPDEVLGPLLEQSLGRLGFDQSYIHRLEPDGAHLALTHSTGLAADTAAGLAHTGLDATLCGIVVKTRRSLILSDLKSSNDPAYEQPGPARLNAYAGFPVIARQLLYGVIAFGSFERPAFDDEEIAFFSTLASYLAVVRGRLHAEAELRDMAETLEQRVEDRTREREALEEQLRQSQKMEAVGQLTGGLAHDFNNLLAGISGSLELMQSRLAEGRLSELGRYIESATNAANRAAALTHRLLAFSRRQTLDAKPVNVAILAAGMEELIQRTVGPAIRVKTTIPPDLWHAFCDPNQLENALLNLAINARDAMPEGGNLIIEASNTVLEDAYTRSQDDLKPGAYVCVAVSDDGSGMPAGVLDRVFDPFFTTKPLGQGTGLGLSMVYGFVKQSEGHVRIHSTPGAGTSVRLYLPRHEGEVGAAPEPSAAGDVPQAGAGETVLVVDDEALVRMLVVEVLTDLGYAALEAVDGKQAMNLLKTAGRIDLLVTDVGLPGGMNGRQLADAARQLRPGLPVLFITGYAETAAVKQQDMESGMAVIIKPFQMDTLTSTIRRILTRS